MDKIGEANKPFEARVSDLLEVERRKKEGDEKTVVVYQPKDVEVIDTSAFIKTDMKYGLDFVFRLVDSVLPGEQMPAFVCPSLVGDQEMLFNSDQLAGKTTLLLFYSKDFGVEGEACLDVMADLAASQEFNLELVAVSTDSIPVHRVWRERREGGGPMIMLADMTGEVSRSFGVLDTGSHLAYNGLFVVDSSGVVQASHMSEAHLPLETAADVVELLREAIPNEDSV